MASGTGATDNGVIQMRRRYRSIYDDLDDMRAYMDYMFGRTGEPGELMLLPGETPADITTISRGGLRVDVTSHDNEVIVTADIMPGVEKDEISIDLVDPQALQIGYERKEEKKEEKEGYYMQERRFGSVCRVIPLPEPVTDEGATATFKNGVLEVHLKRSTEKPKTRISIE
jgi:HSP20 family protein